MTPRKKKIKLSSENLNKRRTNSENPNSKRLKTSDVEKLPDDIQSMKRRNFVTACEQVSCKAYFDFRLRLQVVYLPPCLELQNCVHQVQPDGNKIKQIPSYAEESFKIETKANMWADALEVCQMCITPVQYLSADVMRGIVEIILNAHEDEYADYTTSLLIFNCQQTLARNLNTHPPCRMNSLRICYKNFLTGPMDLKDNTFTNRNIYEYNKGVVKYCMNRLEYEVSSDSVDKPIVDKFPNIPHDMKQSVRGLHWQKEKFEIYECLPRSDRITRLLAVLDSVIEVLQFDLAIWHSRYRSNLGLHLMRSHKPLMASVLWSDNILYTGTVNNNCKQILTLFTYFVHLNYPEEQIKVLEAWLNTIVQTFYICETNSNTDFPSTGKYCKSFAKVFYKIISEIPQESILKVIRRIQPTYMQHLVGMFHVQTLLKTQHDDIIKCLIEFLKTSQWQSYKDVPDDIQLYRKYPQKIKKVKNIIQYLIKKCPVDEDSDDDNFIYPKFEPKTTNQKEITQVEVIYTLYTTLEAFLDAYHVMKVQETLDFLNEQLHKTDINKEECVENIDFGSYSATEQFIKKYRTIYLSLKELMLLFNELKSGCKLPETFKIFEDIGLLGL